MDIPVGGGDNEEVNNGDDDIIEEEEFVDDEEIEEVSLDDNDMDTPTYVSAIPPRPQALYDDGLVAMFRRQRDLMLPQVRVVVVVVVVVVIGRVVVPIRPIP
jgi:hypothetical protein